MKQTIKVVIGSGFGDEGKGLMTDYFCNSLSEKKTLNVRFNGGAQAGHTVVTPDGLRHVFNHIGSGSFNENIATYLSPQFIINPILFRREYESLVNKGLSPEIFVHPNCMVTFPCDMMINQIVEKYRENDRHGSCGVGIYETIMRHERSYISPLFAYRFFPDKLVEAIREYVPERLKELGVKTIPVESMELLNNENILSNYLRDMEFFLNHAVVMDESIYTKFDNIVFEGAQGLLLDKDNRDYFPNLTPSKTGLANVNQQISMIPVNIDKDIEVCFVMRSYLTRHGAGKFLTECDKADIADNLVDLTNHTNEFQGNFRYGYFDLNTFKTAIDKELAVMKYGGVPSIAVTHLDETKDRLITGKGKGITPLMLEAGIKIPVRYASRGMTRNTITNK